MILTVYLGEMGEYYMKQLHSSAYGYPLHVVESVPVVPSSCQSGRQMSYPIEASPRRLANCRLKPRTLHPAVRKLVCVLEWLELSCRFVFRRYGFGKATVISGQSLAGT
jgi:hypothetical protein